MTTPRIVIRGPLLLSRNTVTPPIRPTAGGHTCPDIGDGRRMDPSDGAPPHGRVGWTRRSGPSRQTRRVDLASVNRDVPGAGQVEHDGDDSARRDLNM